MDTPSPRVGVRAALAKKAAHLQQKQRLCQSKFRTFLTFSNYFAVFWHWYLPIAQRDGGLSIRWPTWPFAAIH
jgi:hypothetical protein